jgi:hypothetical protein
MVVNRPHKDLINLRIALSLNCQKKFFSNRNTYFFLVILIEILIHRMFLNVAPFSVTNRSISSTKKKIDFFFNFYLII